MEKRGLIAVFIVLTVLFAAAFATAANEKLSVTLLKDTFAAGDNIPISISLYDADGIQINATADVILEDANKIFTVQKSLQTNAPPTVINLGDNAPAGIWTVTATYGDVISKSLFTIGVNELVSFSLKDDVLTIINTGNTRYTKQVYIAIGDTTGPPKQVDLAVGEQTSFRLVAPQGSYTVQVTDGGKNTFTKSDVALMGPVTGHVIEVQDNVQRSKSPVTGTGGITNDGSSSTSTATGSMFQSKGLVYIFLFVVFGAGILLALERSFRKKAQTQSPLKY